jgi:hypothetical protein
MGAQRSLRISGSGRASNSRLQQSVNPPDLMGSRIPDIVTTPPDVMNSSPSDTGATPCDAIAAGASGTAAPPLDLMAAPVSDSSPAPDAMARWTPAAATTLRRIAAFRVVQISRASASGDPRGLRHA